MTNVEKIAIRALRKIVSCQVDDLISYCRVVDEIALEALIAIEQESENELVSD